MESIPLSSAQKRYAFFTQTVLNNLNYWQIWLTDHSANATALDKKQNSIVKAISFALDLEEIAWSSVFELIAAVSPHIERRGHWDIWKHILIRGLHLAGRLEDRPSEIQLSALLGRLSFQQNHFQESVVYYRQTIRMARRIGDRFNEARACTNLGYYYIEQGFWYRAEVLCCHALRLFEQVDSGHGRAHTENHLGVLYIHQHRWQQAKQRLEQALALWQTMDDAHNLMRVFINFGALYSKMEQAERALEYSHQALHQAQITGAKTAEGAILKNIAIAHRKIGNLDQAEEFAIQAEIIFRRFSDQAGLAKVWNTPGSIYTDQHKWDDARHSLKLSLELSRSLHNRYAEIGALIGMIEYELARGNQQQASIRLEKPDAFIDQHFRNSNYRQVYVQLQSQYRNSSHT